MSAEGDAPDIHPAPPEHWHEALELVFRSVAPEQRSGVVESLVSQAAAQPELLEGLFEARRRGTLTAAAWIQMQPGHVASLWAPQLLAAEAEAVAAGLLNACLALASERRARIAQSLLKTDTNAEYQWLLAAGFQHVTNLLYLVSLDRQFPDAPLASQLEFEPFRDGALLRFVGLIDRTYEKTRDCPSLNGVRDTLDVIEGYRAVGQHQEALWLIVRNQGEDIGCLLLADHPTDGALELVYMGLVPEARGRGYGIELVRHAQWLTRKARRSRLLLAVDADNAPAIDIYAAAGFVTWDSRVVLVQAL